MAGNQLSIGGKDVNTGGAFETDLLLDSMVGGSMHRDAGFSIFVCTRFRRPVSHVMKTLIARKGKSSRRYTRGLVLDIGPTRGWFILNL